MISRLSRLIPPSPAKLLSRLSHAAPHAPVVACSVGEHSDIHRMTQEDPEYNYPVGLGTMSESVRADMVFLEAASGGGVLSVGSTTRCAAREGE